MATERLVFDNSEPSEADVMFAVGYADWISQTRPHLSAEEAADWAAICALQCGEVDASVNRATLADYTQRVRSGLREGEI